MNRLLWLALAALWLFACGDNEVPSPAPATCSDGVKNQDERDVDCGGGCATRCASGKACASSADCESGFCSAGGLCAEPACSDGARNGAETDVDCGGACPAKCEDGGECVQAGDCRSGVCQGGACRPPSCADEVRNADETDVDCGGASCPRCAAGEGCGVGPDCESGVCDGSRCAAATCADGVKNGGETDQDCGGPDCEPCASGACLLGRDCRSGVCASGACAAAACDDAVKNGAETGVDCGGSCPGDCPDGEGCASDQDCVSRVCTAGRCAAPTCADSTWNGSEADLDCGAVCPQRCADGNRCGLPEDCASSSCGVDGICAAPTCSDQIWNGGESDVDCGLACAGRPCAEGRGCAGAGDCGSGVCTEGRCAAATCTDQVLNGAESDVDCGGAACPACVPGLACATGADCDSGVCDALVCAEPACDDRIANGGETGVDCGGPACGKCASGEGCEAPADCASGVCVETVCAEPSCTDAVANGAESAVDCGGADCPSCPDGETCRVAADCASGVCDGGACAAPACTDGLRNGDEVAVDCGGAACPGCLGGASCLADADCLSGSCRAGLCDESTCAGLRGYWTFDEPAGSVAADLAWSHDGALVGAPARETGVLGGAIRFNGASRVSVADHPVLDPGTRDFSVAGWIRIPSGEKGQRRVIAKGTHGAGFDGFALMEWCAWGTVPCGGVAFLLGEDSRGERIVGTCQAMDDGAWHHYAASFDRHGSLDFYVDGTLLTQPCVGLTGASAWDAPGTTGVGNLSGVDFDGPCELCFGGSCQNGGGCGAFVEPFTGSLDDAAIFNRVLTSDEIARLHNGGAGRAACSRPPAAGTIAVASRAPASVAVFPRRAQGDVAPLRRLAGAATGFNTPNGLFATDGELVVGDHWDHSVMVFPRGARGDVAPVRKIAGAQTRLGNPDHLFVAGGEIFVANYGAATTVFGLTDTGDLAPRRVVEFPSYTYGLTVAGDLLYLTRHPDSADANTIYVYPREVTVGPVLRSISGPSTRLNFASDLRVWEGELFVTSYFGNEILVFDAAAQGDVAPKRVIGGAATGLSLPNGIAVGGGEIFVVNAGGAGAVLVFDALATGNVAPKRTLAGAATTLGGTLDVVDDTQDVDLCASANGGCDPNATCAAGLTGTTCSCKPGYTGDGRTCLSDAPTACRAIRAADPTAPSGPYPIDPDGDGPAAGYQAWCDMTTAGGGWTMCYTERAGMVHLATDAANAIPFGTPGYRTACRDIQFKEVLYVNHDTGETASFSRQGGMPITIRALGYDSAGAAGGLWDGAGVADRSYPYQLNACDGVWMSVGLMMSGRTECSKRCGNWCSDTTSHYYRTDGDEQANYNGVAFRENGHRDVTFKTMSVGIR